MMNTESSSPCLSVVIPAYNEESRLVPTLAAIHTYLETRDYSSEMIVVSDGSTDDTARFTQEWEPAGCSLTVIDRKENRGKGYTVREGASRARGELILFSDADHSTPIEEVEKLLPFFRDGYDLVIGSRNLRESELEIHQPFYRELMGRVFNGLVRAMTVRGIRDTQCGFKGFTRGAMEKIAPLCLIDGFSFDVEMLFLARKLGLRIKEVPVRWLNAPGSSISPIRDSVRMFADVCRIRVNAMKGRYDS